jgi:hypothetical protein
LAIIKASTFWGSGTHGTGVIVAEGPNEQSTGIGRVVISSTILSDHDTCQSRFGGVIQNGGFNNGACGFLFNGEPLVETELRNNGGYVPTLAPRRLECCVTSSIDGVPFSFEDCAPGELVHLGLPFTLTDARGVERPQDGHVPHLPAPAGGPFRCDMGAYEVGPSFRSALHTLTITGAGSGTGTVSGGTVSGVGLDCAIAGGAASGQCSVDYGTGTVVNPTATAAADSIFVGWAGDPECNDGSVLMDGAKSCTAVFDLRGLSVSGLANGVGKVRPPKSQGSAQVKFETEFAFAGAIDLASATVTINALLVEEGGAGELVPRVPIVLQARPGSLGTAAIFETPPGVAPSFSVDVQIEPSSLFTVAVAVDGATLSRFPQLCAIARPPSTTLTTRFTIDDGLNPPVTVATREPWRCLAPTAGNRLLPQVLKTP